MLNSMIFRNEFKDKFQLSQSYRVKSKIERGSINLVCWCLLWRLIFLEASECSTIPIKKICIFLRLNFHSAWSYSCANALLSMGIMNIIHWNKAVVSAKNAHEGGFTASNSHV